MHTTRIEQLEAKLAEIQAELAELKKQGQSEKWVPEDNDEYFIPCPTNPSYFEDTYWDNDNYDRHRLKANMVFRTEKEAAEAGKRMYYTHWYQSLSDVTEEMWADKNQKKWFAYWNNEDNKACFDCRYTCKFEGTYFTTKEKCRAAIDEIGEENFKRYVLGVEQ